MHSVRYYIFTKALETDALRLTDGLATVGNAPKIFKKVTKNGLPIVSLLTCAAFSTLAYMGVSTGSGRVFGWFVNSKSPACACQDLCGASR